MLYNMLRTGRITGSAGHRSCKSIDFIHCKRTLRVYSLQPCPTALETAREEWLTAGVELAAAAGFMSSAFRCRVMGPHGRGQPRRVTVAEAELQGKAAISDACTRAADTLKRRRDERGEDYHRQHAQDASDGSASTLPRIENQC